MGRDSGTSGSSASISRPSFCSGVLISSGRTIAYGIGRRRTTFFGSPKPYFTCHPPVIVTIRFPSPGGFSGSRPPVCAIVSSQRSWTR